jgi:alkylation response protein AidB-like acyl-CoA dehydrogenase
MPFFQEAPALGNQYRDDRVLRSYLARALPPEVLRAIEPALEAMGELAGGALYELQLADRANEPVLTQWDAWGRRVDRIEVSPLWRRAARIAAEEGLVAIAYERAHGELARVHQMALAYLFDASTDVYTCPLAMSDGAAKTLLHHGNRALVDRAVPRLLNRDPALAWTSGQWMTERTGGSDVGATETIARRDDTGGFGAATAGGEHFRLYGTKWFTSATTSEMALTLARPEGNPDGGRGLALFYIETRDDDGALRPGITVNRLKDKLGTRKVPTAELALDGAVATAVSGTSDGIRNIAPMLNVTRTWNAVAAASGMRRGLALARDYARKRRAFGGPLADKPLHVETLADVAAEFEAAFHLAMRAAELLGREETGAGAMSGREAELLRVLTPICKLTTARQAVAAASEIVESFGGAGYVEDTGLPRLLRDAQVLSIWEGTTNVLALDVLRSCARGDALAAYADEVSTLARAATDPELAAAARAAEAAVAHARAWLAAAAGASEAGARRLGLTLGRALELALLCRQAQWSLDHERDGRAAAAAARFARAGVDLITDADDPRASALANDTPLPAP